MSTLKHLLRRSALAAGCLFSAAALAQAWPAKAVTIVVPYPPGGGTDALMRIMQPSLAKMWGQTVVVENKPGASGGLGGDYVARSVADGYTLLMSSTGGVNDKNAPQFAPIMLVSASPYVIVANPKVPASNLKELVEYAKKNPSKVTFGSSGPGSASHLSGELFKSVAGIDLLHVPYKGVGQAVADLLGGQIDMLFAPAQAVMPSVNSGKLKAFAVTSAKRATALPEIPTAIEAGVPGYDSVGWFGLFAPVATSRDIVTKVAADANKVLADPEVRQKILALGAEPSGGSPEEFGRFAAADRQKWAKLIKERGLVVQ